ncbi:MAG: hypothetical protein KAX51_08725, partial [Chromatiaceae bacterium]|nr:hypothetical protein [Chromatiaceae bacterium]
SDVLAYDLRGSGTTAPPPRRSHARTYAYRGLPAFASLSMAGSVGLSGPGSASAGNHRAIGAEWASSLTKPPAERR